jgi:hypothetical protein
MKLFRLLVWTQSSYTLITALWPIVDIKSFMIVSGYKTDIWLVKTVSVLLMTISITLGLHLFILSDKRTAVVLGSLTAAALIIIDFYYALTNVINDIYMLDGLIELIFLFLWVYIALRLKKLGLAEKA